MSKKPKTAEYGDFQTPEGLARSVCAMLASQGADPAALLEPSCGLGRFLFAGLDRFGGIRNAIGVDINRVYIRHAETVLRQRRDADRVPLIEADFFHTDWPRGIAQLPV